MGKQVTINPGYSGVAFTLGRNRESFNAGETLVFTDAEYAALTPPDLRAITLVGDAPEPVRAVVTNPGAPVTGQQLLDSLTTYGVQDVNY